MMLRKALLVGTGVIVGLAAAWGIAGWIVVQADKNSTWEVPI